MIYFTFVFLRLKYSYPIKFTNAEHSRESGEPTISQENITLPPGTFGSINNQKLVLAVLLLTSNLFSVCLLHSEPFHSISWSHVAWLTKLSARSYQPKVLSFLLFSLEWFFEGRTASTRIESRLSILLTNQRNSLLFCPTS